MLTRLPKFSFIVAGFAVAAMQLSGCAKKSPVPQDVLDRLRAFVESGGRKPATVDIFSMPGGVTPQGTASATTVTSLRHQASFPAPQDMGPVTKGTVLHYYRVGFSREGPTSAETDHKNFALYLDSSGQWQFYERPEL